MYVVYWCEHLRDGINEGARVVNKTEAALELIDQIKNGFGGCSTTFRLFHLGAEIPLTREVVEKPQPSVKTEKYKLA